MQMKRRSFLTLLALGGGANMLAGCAGAVHGRAEAPGPGYRRGGASRLRTVIFEIAPIGFAFHTGLIIHGPDGHVLYDPAGFWHDPRAPRVDDVSHGLTPELERSYLSRDENWVPTEYWRVHLFDDEVAPDVARLATELSQARAPAAFGACAWNVSAVLQELPGYEDLNFALLPEDLLRQLQPRTDLRYSLEQFAA